MIVRHLINNGLAEVDDELGHKLIDGGHWVDHPEAKPEPKAPAAKRTTS